jgi:hypothetical protein
LVIEISPENVYNKIRIFGRIVSPIFFFKTFEVLKNSEVLNLLWLIQ